MTEAEITQLIADVEQQVKDGLFTKGEGKAKIAALREKLADATWPKREDGTNLEIGEMEPEDRERLLKAAALRWKAKCDDPISTAMQKHLDAIEKM